MTSTHWRNLSKKRPYFDISLQQVEEIDTFREYVDKTGFYRHI